MNSPSEPTTGGEVSETFEELVARLTSERDHYKDVAENGIEPMLRKMSYESGVFDLEFTGDSAKLMALSFVGYFKGSGAKNYLEMNLQDSDAPFDRYTVTIQKVRGKSPVDLLKEATVRIAELEGQIAGRT